MITESKDSSPLDRRDRKVRNRNDLVFIVGVPRSGTTWVLCILENHPDCLAVTPDMLDIAVEHPTKETGLFVRGFSDVEIVNKISLLPRGKVLVEKTPSHLLELGRMRRLFPRSRIILIRRNPLDVIYSMLQENCFWKESPGTLAAAVNLYKSFSEAEAAFTDYDYVLEYEGLVENTGDQVRSLFECLELRTDCVLEIVEKTKCGGSLPPELKGVFRKGIVGEGLVNFTPEELDLIQRELGMAASKARVMSSGSTGEQRKRMRVLLTNHLLRSYTGSEVFTYTIADFLRRRGVEVVAYSKYVGRILADFQAIDVPVVENLEQMRGERFDVAHVHHNINALEVRSYFPDLPIVFLSHGVIPFLEQPPSIDIGISKFLAVSEEVKENMISKGVKEGDTEIFRNIVDSGRFRQMSRINSKPRKALVLSYRIGPRKEGTIRDACKKSGIECKFIGGRFGRVAQELLPKCINEADVIFSLGRGAIESMLCGRVPVVFDYLGGDGMVTPDSFTQLMKTNFSGRRYRVDYTVDQLVDELGKYRSEYGDNLREIALQHFEANRHIDRLLAIYTTAIENYVRTPDQTQDRLLDALVNTVDETRRATREALIAEFDNGKECKSTLEYQLRLKRQLVERAESLMRENKYAEARSILDGVVLFDGYSVAALNDLAAIDIVENQHEKALGLLRRVLALDPQNDVARRNLEFLRQELDAANRQ